MDICANVGKQIFEAYVLTVNDNVSSVINFSKKSYQFLHDEIRYDLQNLLPCIILYVLPYF